MPGIEFLCLEASSIRLTEFRFFNLTSLYRNNILIYIQQYGTLHSFFIWKLLYMFREVPPPIIRSANNYIYSIWYLSHLYCYLPLYTVVCPPDDEWRYHPKHVEQFPDKINCVTLHLVGYIL